MSQNDFNIANQGFPSFRSDLNGALQALASNSAGTSAPATTYAYMWWYDSTNDILKMRNADNDAWINFASFNQATDTWSFASVVIDGDLLVGTTDTDVSDNTTGGGFVVTPSNGVSIAREGSTSARPVLALNQTGVDGEILKLLKDGTTVGSIGNNSATNGLEIYSPVGGGIAFYSAGIAPTNGTGGYVDNSKDVGSPTVRWDDVYATNGTIQTSDANEKQQIAELTAAEMQAAKAISKLFKTFKWNNSVAEKGDDARIHSGVIAQEVEAAMADAGLDAGKYAFFISSTWWEADGQTYDTAEEAPEGAVERTRKGIRYPQLLSFIGAATEQRLASIEARLDAAGL